MARFDRGRTRSRSEIRRRVRGSLLRFLPPSLPPHPRLGLDREESVNGVVPLASLQALTRFLYTAKPSRRRPVDISANGVSSLARACKFASRVFYIDTYTHAHTHIYTCILLETLVPFVYRSAFSEDVDNKLASPSIAFFVQRTASFSLYRAELASSRFRDVSPSSITPHIGLYHDPLVVETPATSCTDVTRIHTHTHTHTRRALFHW